MNRPELLNDPSNANLKLYRVTLHEEVGDKFTIVFDCYAEDEDHAYEQATDMYPSCELINAIVWEE